MNKKFKNLFLAGALALGLAGVAVSCTDYSKDIDELRDENAELKSTVKTLQDKLDAGLSIKSVTPVTDGFTITFSDGSSYTIKNGKDGDDGNDGDKGDNGYYKYYVPGENGLWIEYSTENPNGKETTISCLPSASGAVTAKLSKDGKTLTLSGLEGTDGDFVLSLKAELSSLVFVPELYVDGVAATEYTYFQYDAKKGKNATALTGTITSGDNRAGYNLPASVAAGAWWDYEADDDHADEVINPVFPISYKLNPSNADITGATYSFVSDDKEFIVTRGSVAAPAASFLGANEGVLTIGLKANGEGIAESESTGTGSSLSHANSALSVFALQAKVGGDSTVTSDFAALYASVLGFNHLVVTETVNIEDYVACQDEYKIFTTAKAAIEAAPGLQVAYNKTLDLDEIVTSHVRVSSESSRKAADVEFGDFCESVGIEPLDYINYKYELIDYTVGSWTTSQSQHASLVEGHIFTPCAVTAEGKRDVSNRDVSSVGRKPLVRVTLEDKAGNVILVGFIKIEIVKNSAYDLAKKFENKLKFECFTQEWSITWGEVIENVLRRSGEASSSHEEFVTNYEFDRIDNDPDNVARQYVLANGEFRPASEFSEYLGEVRILNEWNASSATTNVFSWILDDSELSAIYKQEKHTYTIYVRFIPTPGAVNKYDGIYVPLTVTVTKPSGSVGVKLDGNWYDGGTKARINVTRPQRSVSTKVAPWVVDLNSVWSTNPNYYDEPANSPVFNAPKDADGYLFKSFTDVIFGHQNGDVNTNHADGVGGYKFYFAPVQDNFEAKDGTKYQLYVKDTKIYDLYDSDVKTIKANDRISVVEDTLSADVTKGIYTNNQLLCNENLIATINQETGYVTWANNEFANKLLNEYSCANRADAKLFANIGVVAYSPCGVAMSATGNVDEYHFLRPLNVECVNNKAFIDGDNAAGAGSNLDVFDLLKFSDWRYDESDASSAEIANFVNYAEDGTPDYSHLWYLGYYGVTKIKVDIDNITTDMSAGGTAGTLGTTKLTDVTTSCRISYFKGTYNNPTSVSNNTANLSYGTSAYERYIPVYYSSRWETESYCKAAAEVARKQFGFIHYANNNYNTVGATLRIPIEVTYAFGTISTYVDVKINDTI